MEYEIDIYSLIWLAGYSIVSIRLRTKSLPEFTGSMFWRLLFRGSAQEVKLLSNAALI